MAPCDYSPRGEKTAQIYVWLYILAAAWTTLTIPIRFSNLAQLGYSLFSIVSVPAEPSLVSVVFLIAVATIAARRLRAAHTAMVIVAVLNTLSFAANLFFLITDPSAEEISRPTSWSAAIQSILFSAPVTATALVISAITCFIVIRMRPAFPGRINKANIPKAVGVLAVGLAISFTFAFTLTWLTPVRHAGMSEVTSFAFASSIGSTEPLLHSSAAGHPVPYIIFYTSGAISAIALTWALIVWFRSTAKPHTLTAEEEIAIRRLINSCPTVDSLSYFATRRDKCAVFSPDHKAAVLFGAVGNVFVASGDPVGERSSWPAAVLAWYRYCRDSGVRPTVLACSQEAARLYRSMGLSIVDVGDEAVVHSTDFDLNRPALSDMRKTIRRMNRENITCEVMRAKDVSPTLAAQLLACRDTWRAGQAERGFSMALGRLGDPADLNTVIAIARDAANYPVSFLTFVPWGRNGLSLDLMLHSPATPAGVTDYLVAQTVLHGGDMGIKQVSLNFAMFRDVFVATDELRAGLLTRASDRILKVASKSFQIESLYRSNQKYQPHWSPRWIAFDPTMSVIHAGYAMAVAEGFVPPPNFTAVIAWLWAGITGRAPTPHFGHQPSRHDPEFLHHIATLDHEFTHPPLPTYTWSVQQQQRLAHKCAFEAAGIDPYPVQGQVSTTSAKEVIFFNSPVPAPGSYTNAEVVLTGRTRSRRALGGLIFMDVEHEGWRVQAVFDRSRTGSWEMLANLDVGDVVSIRGQVGTTRTGELSVFVDGWTLLAKSIRPTPPLGHPVGEELRRTNRSLDLITDVAARDVLVARAAAVRALRDTMHAKRYMEVETPMLHTVHGGAAARPFTTHINAYDMDLSLRIAPELYLKRLMVGGLDRIFEIGRNFRNEGVDATHNPEFTSLEAYATGLTYTDMQELTIQLIEQAARAVNGAPVAKVRGSDGRVEEMYLPGSWRSMTVHEAVSKAVGLTLTLDTPVAEYAAACRDHAVVVDKDASTDIMLMELYDQLVEKQTVEPTFYYDFPATCSPLARPGRRDARVSEQWDLVVCGMEIGTAYSELIDPVIQRQRLTEQSLAAAAGDPEAMEVDADFLAALELGVAPMGGLGLGVDRVVMLLTGTTIRQTLAFPFSKPAGSATRSSP